MGTLVTNSLWLGVMCISATRMRVACQIGASSARECYPPVRLAPVQERPDLGDPGDGLLHSADLARPCLKTYSKRHSLWVSDEAETYRTGSVTHMVVP